LSKPYSARKLPACYMATFMGLGGFYKTKKGALGFFKKYRKVLDKAIRDVEKM